MNPVRVATGIVEALRVQPFLLALVLLNIAFMVIVYLAVHEQRATQAEIVKLMLEEGKQAQALLAKCGAAARPD